MNRLKSLITFLILLSCTQLFAQEHPYTLKVDSFATIQLPVKPRETAIKNGSIYSEFVPPYLYYVQVNDLSKVMHFNISSTDDPSEFYNGIVKGTLQSTSGRLLNQRNLTIDGLQGFEFEYEARDKAGLIYHFQRALLIDKKAVVYSIWMKNDLDSSAIQEKQRFFSTFKLNNPPDVNALANTRKAYKPDKDKIIHILLYYFLPAFVIILALIIGLGTYLQKRKRSKQNFNEYHT